MSTPQIKTRKCGRETGGGGTTHYLPTLSSWEQSWPLSFSPSLCPCRLTPSFLEHPQSTSTEQYSPKRKEILFKLTISLFPDRHRCPEWGQHSVASSQGRDSVCSA